MCILYNMKVVRVTWLERVLEYEGTCCPTHPPTCLPACLPACLPTYLPTYLPTFLPIPTCLYLYLYITYLYLPLYYVRRTYVQTNKQPSIHAGTHMYMRTGRVS